MMYISFPVHENEEGPFYAWGFVFSVASAVISLARVALACPLILRLKTPSFVLAILIYECLAGTVRAVTFVLAGPIPAGSSFYFGIPFGVMQFY